MTFPVPRKFAKLFRDGITTKMSYLTLRIWNGRGGKQSVVAAIQPHINRLDEDTIAVGGKIRLSFDDLGYYDLQDLLAKGQDVAWGKQSNQRVSAIFGSAIKVGMYERRGFEKNLPGSMILNALEKTFHTKFEDKDNLVDALNAVYKLSLDHLFKGGKEGIEGEIKATESKLETLKSVAKGGKVAYSGTASAPQVVTHLGQLTNAV